MLLTVAIAAALRLFVVQPFIVDGESMEPNFHNQDYIMIDKLSYRFSSPKRGDVVVFHPPVNASENYIKRIIGLPGETVSLSREAVYINGRRLNEPYFGQNQFTTEPVREPPTITLDRYHYFVLGDNRAHSSDSRDWGPLDERAIEGRTWFIAFPVADFRAITTPDYIL